jgi:hypothetical protein
MARYEEIDPQQVQIAGEGPIVLAGQPNSLRGNLYLRNSSPARVRLRRLPLSIAKKDQLALAAPDPGSGPVVRLAPRIIRPGHTGPVSLSLRLDPHTSPGEYRAEMEIAGQMRPVVMHVIEKVDLRISPSVVVLENHPDATFSKRILVSNLGNVPLTIGRLGAIFLDDELLICRTLRHAAASVGDDLRPFEEYLARILLSAKQVAESSGILRVYNRSGETTIQPGEDQPVDLDIRIPPSLDRRGRYRGVSAIYTANLTFLIVPTAGPSLPDEKPPVDKLEVEPAPKKRRRRGNIPPANPEENQ